MGFPSVLSAAHRLVAERVRPGDAVVDATVGGGNDTLFLAKLSGPTGEVFGFDIQPEALAAARRKCAEFTEPASLAELTLFADSHAEMERLLPVRVHGAAAAVMFNLGYLPGGDHRVITRADSTIPALQAALRVLRPGGVVTVVVYSGHDGGLEEAAAVDAWAQALPQDRFPAMTYRLMNQRNHPPYLIAITPR